MDGFLKICLVRLPTQVSCEFFLASQEKEMEEALSSGLEEPT